MKKVVYISTVGIERKTKEPNLGPFIAGLMNIKANRMKEIHLLIDIEENDIIQKILKIFPIYKKKIFSHKIKAFEYESTLEQILKIYKIHKDEDLDFIVNVTGGTRTMTLGAFMGAVLIGGESIYIKEASLESGDEDVLSIVMPRIPIYDLHKIQKLIIYSINKFEENGEKKMQYEIMDSINHEFYSKKHGVNNLENKLAPQKMSYHCKILENNEIIKRSHDKNNNKSNVLELTRLGKMIAKFIVNI